MVEDYNRMDVVCLYKKLFQSFALTITSVVTTNNLHTIGQCYYTVTKKTDRSIGQEALALPYSTDVFMISRYHVDAHWSMKRR